MRTDVIAFGSGFEAGWGIFGVPFTENVNEFRNDYGVHLIAVFAEILQTLFALIVMDYSVFRFGGGSARY